LKYPEHISSLAINFVKKMLRFDAHERPSLEELEKDP